METTMDEIKAFLEGVQKADVQLDPAELENAAGGKCNSRTGGEAAISVISLGLGCAVYAYVSATEGYTGQKKARDGRLCNEGRSSDDD
ncbi:MAG: hypothetical protein IK093_17180 [Ruminiclostridium sp.]|nr:hypothetical protein [Ruminiclostridium sp.]